MRNAGLLWGLIGLIGGGVISFFIALLFHKLSNSKTLYYEIFTEKYYSTSNDEFSLTFLKKPIEQLNISHVRMYYKGSGLLTSADFIDAQPLMLKDLDYEGKIYAIKNFKRVNYFKPETYISSTKPNESSLGIKSAGKNVAILEFEYFENNKPLEFLVFHNSRLQIEGKLIHGSIKEKNKLLNRIRNFDASDFFIWGGLLITCISFLVAIILGLVGSISK